MIRKANASDLDAIKCIADANRNELGFVMRPALTEAQARGELLVAERGDAVVGFVNYRTLSRVRRGWHTVYEICVTGGWRGQGIGAELLDAVPRPVRLKCPVDLPANGFYRVYGMHNVWTEQPDGRRALNVWQTQPDVIYCAGGNREFARIAVEAGMLYGTRHDDTPAYKPYMLDINWKRYDWRDYLDKVGRWQPHIAMVPDYEHEWQRGRMVRMACQLVERGVERVMVCPKFAGAVSHIPDWCLVAISVPSGYAGFLPDPAELTGRRVHLLGGVPQAQMQLARTYGGLGITVSSVDLNAHKRAALLGSIWQPRRSGTNWHYPRNGLDAYSVFGLSTSNILTAWRQGVGVQMALPMEGIT